jgi:hypothetical protein
MSPYNAVYGREYPPLDTYQTALTSVPASDDYYNRHQEIRNTAFQVSKLAIIRSTRTAATRNTPRPAVPVGGLLLVLGDWFATESGRSRKLHPCWRRPFTVTEYNWNSQNYTVKLDARMYRRKHGVFLCLVVKPYDGNDDKCFPG